MLYHRDNFWNLRKGSQWYPEHSEADAIQQKTPERIEVMISSDLSTCKHVRNVHFLDQVH